MTSATTDINPNKRYNSGINHLFELLLFLFSNNNSFSIRNETCVGQNNNKNKLM